MKQCELCGNTISTKYGKRFCSLQCRNTYVSRQKVKKPIPSNGKRFYRRQCFKCGKISDRAGDYCQKCRRHPHRWTEEEERILIEHYATQGAMFCAKLIGRPLQGVRVKARKLGLSIEQDAYKRLVHGAAQAYMTEHNPMLNSETVEKVQDYYRQHPDKKEARHKRFMEGHSQLRKDKPSKLEAKMCSILDTFGITYEAQFLIKDKFIVDVRIGNIIIQADGEYWHGHPRFEPLTERQLKQQTRDKAQDKYLASCGYTVYRIWERDMNTETIKSILVNHGYVL